MKTKVTNNTKRFLFQLAMAGLLIGTLFIQGTVQLLLAILFIGLGAVLLANSQPAKTTNRRSDPFKNNIAGKFCLAFLAITLTSNMVIGKNLSQNTSDKTENNKSLSENFAQSNDSLFKRHSFQFNIAGLGFERYGIAYELRLTPRHALFVQGGGSFPEICEEIEYGFGVHYKYFLQAVRDAKFLGLFKSAYRNTFLDLNVRYMNLDGIYEDANFVFDSFYVGAGIGQTYIWNSGFTISYWLGYGPPIGSEFNWESKVPTDGNSWAKTYKYASGLDFGFSLGYSF